VVLRLCVEIIEAHLPDELPVLRQLMAEYLLEFDPNSEPALFWDNEYYEVCQDGVKAGTTSILFARENTQMIGFLITRAEPLWYRPSLLLGHFEELYVHAKFRRKGVGRLLVDTARARFKKLGIQTATASVLLTNPGAVSFWKQVGLDVRVYRLFGQM
jgi:ribosomal protein S18 acetylase RimI-like enzyme